MASSPRGSRVRVLALVGAGGFAGTVLRWLLDGWVGTALPLGTLAANVLAAFLLGVVLSDGRLSARVSGETRLLVGTGFCGSLSTYSTFAAEAAAASAAVAGGYVVATYALGFAGVVAGDLFARWVS